MYKHLRLIASGQANAVNLSDASSDLIKEIQTLLSMHPHSKYHVAVDGIAGEATKRVFAAFKISRWLDYPEKLGASTAKALLEIAEKHQVSEQKQSSYSINADAGSKTGNKMRLPDGVIVYENEYIVAGIPLAWGEMTKGCASDRIPESPQIVQNAIRTAKGFGRIREKFGSPIAITSAYRPRKVNRRIGGALDSQHIYALALDLCPLNGDFTNLLRVCRDSDCVGIGLGMKKGFIHADWRNGDRVVFDY